MGLSGRLTTGSPERPISRKEGTMKYEIIGGAYPAVKCILNRGEKMRCEGGSMSWMTDGLSMKTEGGGSIGKALGRSISGEGIFFNVFEAEKDEQEIAFSASFPGRILAINLKEGQSIIAQKGAFLACTEGINVQMHFKKKLGAGLFGGLGFFMQKFTGTGTLFLEIDGNLEEKTLQAGERIKIDAPYLAMMTESCSMDIEKIKGVKNMVFGGEGMFNTVVTGPGKVWLQTMPMSALAMAIAKYMPSKE